MGIARAREALMELGVVGFMRHAADRARSELERFRPSTRRWMRDQVEKDRQFDARYGVDTGGIIRLTTLGIESAHRRFGVDYIGIDPEYFDRTFSRLEIRHEDFVFVDLGSGKGRALLLASEFPFRRIVGVEFAPELHRVAEQNVRQYRSPKQRCSNFELHCTDAASFAMPEEPLVVFLYNPFGAEVVQKIAAGLLASHAKKPREMLILYATPMQLPTWQSAGFDAVDSGNLFAILKPSSN